MRLRDFKIGDKAEAIDEAIAGTIIAIANHTIVLEDNSGFQFQFNANELMHSKPSTAIEQSIYNTDINAVKQSKELPKKPKSTTTKPKQRHAPKLVIDLHIHHLVESTKRMTNFEMLNLQVDTARRQLEFAMKKRIPKLVFIHGVGEGVLKQELETLFGRYNNVQYYDADFKTYGFGATEVRILQNIAP